VGHNKNKSDPLSAQSVPPSHVRAPPSAVEACTQDHARGYCDCKAVPKIQLWALQACATARHSLHRKESLTLARHWRTMLTASAMLLICRLLTKFKYKVRNGSGELVPTQSNIASIRACLLWGDAPHEPLWGPRWGLGNICVLATTVGSPEPELARASQPEPATASKPKQPEPARAKARGPARGSQPSQPEPTRSNVNEFGRGSGRRHRP
jgi:hypothetical protein